MNKRLLSNSPQYSTSKSHKQSQSNNPNPQESDFKHKPSNEKYFETSSSEGSDLNLPKQEIVERTKDKSFGRFDEMLGSGVFKQVYRGYDFNAGREIAWSIINITCSSTSQKSFEKITEEVNILKQLNHPNIIHFITGWHDEVKKQVIIITELVSGGSLKENLKRIKEPRLRLVKKWIIQILSGLDYLHKKDIIHRDLKCANIFLDNFFGNVKIGDLGGSELLYQKYGTNYGGTEEFMAPEIVEGKYTVKADIYSLGMSVIEMLTHERPYKECDGPMAIYYNITHGIYPESMNKIENENMIRFIKLCLRRESERPSAEELLLNEYLKDEISEENNHPVKIINHLRQNNISSKYQNEIKPLQFVDKTLINKPLTMNNKCNIQEFSTMIISQEITQMNKKDICHYDINKKQKELSKMLIPLQILSNNDKSEKKEHHQISVFSPQIAKKSTYEFNNKEQTNNQISNFSPKDISRKEYRKALSNISSKSALSHGENSSPFNSKSSLFKKKGSSSFVITIKENTNSLSSLEKDINNTAIVNNDLNSSTFSQTNSLNTEVEISFVVSRDEWKNKKRLICPYNFETDTVDGLASELRNVINLSSEEYQIVRNKLNESITKYTSTSTCSSQRNTLSSISGDIKSKGKYDEFLSAFNSLTNRMKSLLHNDSTKRLEDIVNNGNNFNKLRSDCICITDFPHKMEVFKKKEKCLLNIINQASISTFK